MTEETDRQAEGAAPAVTETLPLDAAPGLEGEGGRKAGQATEPIASDVAPGPEEGEGGRRPAPESPGDPAKPSMGEAAREALRRDPAMILAVVALVGVLLLGWLVLARLGGLGGEVAAMGARVDAVEARLSEAHSQQARAALRRLEVELQGLRETLPPALGADLDAAAEALGRVKTGVGAKP